MDVMNICRNRPSYLLLTLTKKQPEFPVRKNIKPFRCKFPKVFFSILLISFISLTFLAIPDLKGEEKSSYIKILKEDENGIVLELKTSHFDTGKEFHNNTSYKSIEIPGLEITREKGKPQIPFKSILIGIPPQKRIKISILNTKSSIFKGYNLYPSPRIFVKKEEKIKYLGKEFSIDKSFYLRNSFYPAKLAEITFTGYMREQELAQIKIYPIQCNPASKEMKFHESIRLEIVFIPENGTVKNFKKGIKGNGPYEEMLKSLLINYRSLGYEKKKPVNFNKNLYRGKNKSLSGAGEELVKVYIEEDGIYRIDFSEIENLGINISQIPPENIKMKTGGKEIPLYVFDNYILFYGRGNRSEYTKANVYWLSFGEGNGLRMSTTDGTPSTSSAPEPYFKETAHFEENGEYWQNKPISIDNDHWLWAKIQAQNSKEFSFQLNNLADAGDDILLRFGLEGATENIEMDDPDHHVRVYLNENLIDDGLWKGQTRYLKEVLISQSLFRDGANVLKIEAPGDTGSNVDSFYLNWFEVEFLKKIIAENDFLMFSYEGTGQKTFEITNFSGSDIEVYDITQEDNPLRVLNSSVESSGNYYKVKFNDNIENNKKYIALTTSKIKKPAIKLVTFQDIKSSITGADYIIITHEDFYQSVMPLSDYRKSKGLRVEVVKIEDIYDNFSYGIFDPTAIKEFLKFAYKNWTLPRPTYVLLVGDANFDYKGNLVQYKGNLYAHTINYVPTYMLDTNIFGQTPSDNWFVCVNGDDYLPDMFIGRIPVKSKEDADAVINKIISYSENEFSWKKNVLLVADNDLSIFESLSDELATQLESANFISREVYLKNYPIPANATSDIINYINDGALLTNYSGHGSLTKWATEVIFKPSDIGSLTNKEKLTFVVTLNCLNAYFALPSTKSSQNFSLGEDFLRAKDKGAIAFYGPTGIGYPEEHSILAKELFSTIFEKKRSNLGYATTQAKISAFGKGVSQDIVATFTLLGDPGLRLLPNTDTTPPVATASPSGGTYSISQLVTLSADEPSTIYYTLDGLEPTIASSVYTEPISIDSDTTLNFFAVDEEGNVEVVKTENYVIDITAPDIIPPVTTASPVGGTYTTSQTVILTTNESATIYYTLNGLEPTIASSVYTEPIIISSDTTLKFFAVDTAGNAGDIKTENYIIRKALTILSEVLPDGEVGNQYTFTFEATGGKPSYKWLKVSGRLPLGLKLDKKSGGIYGRPKKAGKFSFKIQVKDSGKPQRRASKKYSITIKKMAFLLQRINS